MLEAQDVGRSSEQLSGVERNGNEAVLSVTYDSLTLLKAELQ